MARKEICSGQRYRSIESRQPDWVVTRVYGQQGLPHAIVVSAADKTTMKTLACSVLLDAKRYQFIPAEVPKQIETAA